MGQFLAQNATVRVHLQDVSQQLVAPFQSATQSPIEEAIDVLEKASTLAKNISPSMNFITKSLKKVVNVVDDIETVISDLNEVVTIGNTLAEIGIALTEIPIVGEVTDFLAGGLESFTTMVDGVLIPLNDFKNVLNEVKPVIGKIYDVCSEINGYITYFATK